MLKTQSHPPNITCRGHLRTATLIAVSILAACNREDQQAASAPVEKARESQTSQTAELGEVVVVSTRIRDLPGTGSASISESQSTTESSKGEALSGRK